MAEPVEWRADGTPYSPRFQDRYRSEDGGLAQATEVFLAGCGLPDAWRGHARWCVLETGFGLGLNFLATWRAWRDDPGRPTVLHYLATEAFVADACDLRRNAADHPGLQALGDALAERWGSLETGTHRIALDGGRVMLTLLVGDSAGSLRGLGRLADSVYLDGFSPERNPDMWSLAALRAVARCCRRDARLATWTVARPVRDGLQAAGFEVHKVPGVAPKRHNLQARLAHLPAHHVDAPEIQPGHCTVIGAGLAGAAVARALALRGWQVRVREAGPRPAAGASGVPAGLFAPHVSADDAPLSRISRAGVRALRHTAQDLLRPGLDWQDSGVRQRDAGQEDRWHADGGWVRPARLVEALLATPGITLGCDDSAGAADSRAAAAAARDGDFYPHVPPGLPGLRDAPHGAPDLVVIAAGHASPSLTHPPLPMQAVAGQVSHGPAGREPASPHPWNGHGHFIPWLPEPGGGHGWLAGASFERDSSAIEVPEPERLAHRQGNQQRLAELLPALAPALPGWFDQARDWRGVRGTSPDRLPIVGPWPDAASRVWTCTGLGARGITLALLCADLLAARLHGEPLPLAPRLADMLEARRMLRRLPAPAVQHKAHKQVADSS